MPWRLIWPHDSNLSRGRRHASPREADDSRPKGRLDQMLQASCGCLGSRLSHLKAGIEFFQKNFSAAESPIAIVYVFRMSTAGLLRPAYTMKSSPKISQM